MASSAFRSVGFIGLGNVGGKLAGSLAGGSHDLTIFDLDRTAAQPCGKRGGGRG